MNMEELFRQSPEHEKLFEKIRTLCLSLPGTSERMSHGAPSFFIKEKVSFVQYRVHHHGDGRIALWCAAPSGVQAMLTEASPELYFKPPYVGHLGWVGMRLDQEAAWEEIAGMIGEAYMSRAPQKLKEQLKNGGSRIIG